MCSRDLIDSSLFWGVFCILTNTVCNHQGSLGTGCFCQLRKVPWPLAAIAPIIVPFPECRINGLKVCSFCIWLLSLSTVLSRFRRVLPCVIVPIGRH